MIPGEGRGKIAKIKRMHPKRKAAFLSAIYPYQQTITKYDSKSWKHTNNNYVMKRFFLFFPTGRRIVCGRLSTSAIATSQHIFSGCPTTAALFWVVCSFGLHPNKTDDVRRRISRLQNRRTCVEQFKCDYVVKYIFLLSRAEKYFRFTLYKKSCGFPPIAQAVEEEGE